MAKDGNTYAKRQRETLKRQKQDAKRERRQKRKDQPDTPDSPDGGDILAVDGLTEDVPATEPGDGA